MSASARLLASSSRAVPMQKPPPWIVRSVGSVCGEVWSYVFGKKILCFSHRQSPAKSSYILYEWNHWLTRTVHPSPGEPHTPSRYLARLAEGTTTRASPGTTASCP